MDRERKMWEIRHLDVLRRVRVRERERERESHVWSRNSSSSIFFKFYHKLWLPPSSSVVFRASFRLLGRRRIQFFPTRAPVFVARGKKNLELCRLRSFSPRCLSSFWANFSSLSQLWPLKPMSRNLTNRHHQRMTARAKRIETPGPPSRGETTARAKCTTSCTTSTCLPARGCACLSSTSATRRSDPIFMDMMWP